MKLFYYDVETTGTKFWRNSIHQLSGAIEIDGEVVERFNFRVRPHEKAEIDPVALEIGGVTLEQIQAYPTMGEVYGQLTAMLKKYVDKYNKTDKFYLVGFNNAAFDNAFLRAFFIQNHDEYFGSWFWSNCFDVMVLATKKLAKTRHLMPNFKLKSVAAALGIDVDESRLHDAEYDIELTKLSFERL